MEQCENCKYYVQHYSISKTFGIVKVCCGHCINKNAKMKKRLKNCEHFEVGESERTEKLKTLSILKSIERANASCKYIAEMLQEIKNNFKN